MLHHDKMLDTLIKVVGNLTIFFFQWTTPLVGFWFSTNLPVTNFFSITVFPTFESPENRHRHYISYDITNC